MNDIFKTGEAALYLDKSVNTLQRLDRQGKLVAHRTKGSRRYYTKDQLDDYIKQHTSKLLQSMAYTKEYTKQYNKTALTTAMGRFEKSANETIKRQGENLLILGNTGTGKNSLVQRMAMDNKNLNFYQLDFDYLVYNTKQNYVRINLIYDHIVDELSTKGNCVLVIDEAWRLIRSRLFDSNTTSKAIHNPRLHLIMLAPYNKYREWMDFNPMYRKWFQRIDLPEASEKQTVVILHQRADMYSIDVDDKLLTDIYQKTSKMARRISQPKASIEVFDNMIGWHMLRKDAINEELLVEAIK